MRHEEHGAEEGRRAQALIEQIAVSSAPKTLSGTTTAVYRKVRPIDGQNNSSCVNALIQLSRPMN